MAWTRRTCSSARAPWAIGSRCYTFMGPDIVAVRWKQWRIYLKDMNPTGTDQQKLGGLSIKGASLNYPKIYNIQVDPHEDLQLPNYLWAMGPPLKTIAEYEASVKKYPNPPSGNLTDFRGRVGELGMAAFGIRGNLRGTRAKPRISTSKGQRPLWAADSTGGCNTLWPEPSEECCR